MPEVEIEDYLPEPGPAFKGLNKRLLRNFVNKLFNAQVKLERSKIETRLSGNLHMLLQPHALRLEAYQKYKEI
jgi:hypothetical protein